MHASLAFAYVNQVLNYSETGFVIIICSSQLVNITYKYGLLLIIRGFQKQLCNVYKRKAYIFFFTVKVCSKIKTTYTSYVLSKNGVRSNA